MRKLVKKAALTTLSAVAILSAVPSVFCAPDGKNQNVNVKGHIDPFHIMIVGKYFNSVEDFKNLEMVNKKYEMTMEKYRLNPLEIDSEEVLRFFPSIETCRVEKFKGKNFISTFPSEKIKTMIYLPNSFNSSQFKEVLKDNGIVDENGNPNDNWERSFELCSENSLDGCKVTFTDGDKKIIFMFDPCVGGTIFNGVLDEYNKLLSECGIEEAAAVKVSGEFTIPDSVTSIGKDAFADCGDLTSVTIPNSVISIGEGAFADCLGLTKINIPASVTSIGKDAFYGCESLTNITIPNSVTSIGKDAFLGCESLTNITIPESVTSIGEGAFSGCENLDNIVIPNSVTSIKKLTFLGCKSLTTINIPNSVTSIGKGAFTYCSNLTNVTIPDSVTSIEDAFSGCESLTNINIPTSVTSIGSYAFLGCESLTTINIPDNVTSIGESAFIYCESLTNVNIPNSVISIGKDAFACCRNLTNVNIPTSVTSIGENAFVNCGNLTHIEFNGEVYDSVDSFMQAFKDYRVSQQ